MALETQKVRFMALENPKSSDLWRWKPKKFRFMALENLKISDLWRWR